MAKVLAYLRRHGHSEEARRLLEAGEAGYPGEEDFPAIAAVAGFSFSVLQDTIRDELVYASELGPVRLTVRRHYIGDGSGKLSPHFGIVSHDPPLIKVYEELPAFRLDAYRDFLQSCMRADRSIGNTALIGMLEETHGVSAKNGTYIRQP